VVALTALSEFAASVPIHQTCVGAGADDLESDTARWTLSVARSTLI